MELYFRVYASKCEWAYEKGKENEILTSVCTTFEEAYATAKEDGKKYDGVRFELTDGNKVYNEWIMGYNGNDEDEKEIPIECDVNENAGKEFLIEEIDDLLARLGVMTNRTTVLDLLTKEMEIHNRKEYRNGYYEE